jgi:CHASE2 domain-containing sensor protein/signal transduction histidine kinase
VIRRRLLIEWCGITLMMIAIVGGLAITRGTARIDNAFYDLFVGFRAPPPSGRILLVTIDDPSIAALGRWPWPRDVHARMVRRLAAARPAAIAYDIFFTEPGHATADTDLAAAIKDAGSVLLPVLFEVPGRDGQPIDATPPVPSIADGAAGLGEVALLPDSDGTARSAMLSFAIDGRAWPHLMELAYRLAMHRPSPAFRRAIRSGDTAAAIPFQPATGSFRSVSFASVLAGEVPAAFFRDHVVLVGVTAAGLGDRYRVPLREGNTMAGIEIQANLLNDLLADRLVHSLSMPATLVASLLPSLLLLVGFWWLPPNRAFIASCALIGIALVAPAAMLAIAGLWLPPMPMLIGLLMVYPLWGWRRLQATDRAIGEELALFAQEPMPVPPSVPLLTGLDPIGGQTERLRASIAWMRDLRSLVADTIEGVDDPLLVTGLDDQVLLANRPAHALFGRDPVGHSLARLLIELGGERILPEGPSDEIVAGNGRTFSLRRSPLRSGEALQRGWILLMADISAIREAERERGEAIEFLTHDMRAPQSAIIALLEGGEGDDVPQGVAGRVIGHARRTLALADNFVQLARLRATRYAPEETDLSDIAIEATDALWSMARRRGIRVVAEGTDEPRLVLGERSALLRAVINLLDNAVKFSPDGGDVRCEITESSGHIFCAVEDEGSGIAVERAKMLFDRFGPIVRKAGAMSSGLGLAYVRSVVERHGGEIRYEARAPRGARFLIMFPAIDSGS